MSQRPQPQTILADENIAYLDDYFLGHSLIKLAGRDITQAAIDAYRPSALLIRSVTPIDASNQPNLSGVRFVASATLGTDHVDSAYLARLGIAFASAQGSSKHSVAQYVITALLTQNQALIHARHTVTLGIIGLGNIGSTLARYASDLGWQVLGHDPFLSKSTLNNSTFEQLMADSDIISLHTPLTKDGKHPTYRRFDKRAFDLTKDNAIFVNSARGEIVVQDALIDAIDQKNLQAILDVFPHEPTIDRALLDRLSLATPHIAGYTLDAKLRGTDMIYQAFCRFFDLPITQHMATLVTPNPYHWPGLVSALQSGQETLLSSHYDILRDDQSLRAALDGQQIAGNAFDALRKHYPLKREWLYGSN